MAEFTEKEKGILQEKGLLFGQLLESQKFRHFFEMNYDVVRNDDTKEIFIRELPPEEVNKRLAESIKKMEESMPKITPPTPEELAAIKKSKK